MKKTLTINLNGIVFHIDDDAYQTLQQYIADISMQLGTGDEVKEIIADIEARIAELFTNMLESSKQEVVNIEMVNSVKSTMGKPSDYGDGEEQPQAKQAQNKRNRKRFYRDTDNQILSGVCSGIAAYLGWDTVLVRILFVIMTVFGWWAAIPIYIIMWIISPAAETAAQRLEMRGENPTVENIKNEFANTKNYMESERFRAQANNLGQRFIQAIFRILKFCFSLFVAFLGFIAFVVIGALLIALVAVLFGLGSSATATLAFSSASLFNLTPWVGVLFLISAILVVGVPVFSLIFGLAKYLKTKRGVSSTYNWISTIIWVLATVTFLHIGFTKLNWSLSLDSLGEKVKHEKSNVITQMRTTDPFHSIVAKGAFEMDLRQDANQLLSVTASEENQQYVEAEVRDSVLYISTTEYFPDLEIQISNANLRSVTVAGACSLKSENCIRQSTFKVELAGASKADMDMHIDSLFVIEVAGASKIELDGYAKNVDMHVVGASKIDADDMQTDNAQVYCAGGSKINLWCENDLKVQVYGASKVRYKGDPNLSERICVGASKINKD